MNAHWSWKYLKKNPSLRMKGKKSNLSTGWKIGSQIWNTSPLRHTQKTKWVVKTRENHLTWIHSLQFLLMSPAPAWPTGWLSQWQTHDWQVHCRDFVSSLAVAQLHRHCSQPSPLTKATWGLMEKENDTVLPFWRTIKKRWWSGGVSRRWRRLAPQ